MILVLTSVMSVSGRQLSERHFVDSGNMQRNYYFSYNFIIDNTILSILHFVESVQITRFPKVSEDTKIAFYKYRYGN